MKPIDQLYQKTIDAKVEQLLKKSVQEIKNLKNYGHEIVLNEKKIEIGWWKYELSDNLIHIVYKTSRRFLLFLHKPYLQGLKISDNKIEYLTDEELAEYD